MLEPNCPAVTTCGGCPLLDVDPARARSMREARLHEALQQHFADSRMALPMRWVARPRPEGYRRRIRLRVFEDARLGFFNESKYRSCPVLTPALRQVLLDLLTTAERHRDALSLLHHVELREPDMDGIASAFFVKREATRPLPPVVLRQLGDWLAQLHWGVAAEADPIPCQRLALPTIWQYVPIGSFLQINQAINSTLVRDLLTSAKERNALTFCDLYAGSGNFTLPLLAAGLTGDSIELDPCATRAAQRAAQAQHLPHTGFTIGDSEAFAARAASSGKAFDLVIVDPPRAGVRHEILSMATLARNHLVYCSCNSLTLARDLGLLRRARFEIESVTLYDMFEHTEHVEAMVWLRAPSQVGR